MNKIFLGGTCNSSTWRDELIPLLNKSVLYFNPVVEDWTEEHQAIEINERENKCTVHLYCITSKLKGVYSIAEVIDSVHIKSKKTVFCVITDGFDEFMIKSLKATANLVKSRGGEVLTINNEEIAKLAELLNSL